MKRSKLPVSTAADDVQDEVVAKRADCRIAIYCHQYLTNAVINDRPERLLGE